MGGDNRRRPRRLGPEERRLWERIAATASPLHAPRAAGTRMPAARDATPRLTPDDEGPPGKLRGPPLVSGITLRPTGSGNPGPTIRTTFAGPDAAPVGRPQAGLDRRTAERLRKGARTPDSRIDLHGMSAERAHMACLRFLADASRRGDRVVLVITGKGRRDGSGRGVLRESLPGWLRASPLGHSVVGIYQAHRRHGGEGAFYVYLKRHR